MKVSGQHLVPAERQRPPVRRTIGGRTGNDGHDEKDDSNHAR
jgi:hypothetical protein